MRPRTPWGTWSRWSQRRPGQPGENWDPGTTWCWRKERSKGRAWNSGSCRPKGTARRQRRQWLSSTTFAHELEGVCLEKRGREGYRRDSCKSFHCSLCGNLFYELQIITSLRCQFVSLPISRSTVPSLRSTQKLPSMSFLLVTLKLKRVTAAVVVCILPSMASSVPPQGPLTVHSTRKQTWTNVKDTLKATVTTLRMEQCEWDSQLEGASPTKRLQTPLLVGIQWVVFSLRKCQKHNSKLVSCDQLDLDKKTMSAL